MRKKSFVLLWTLAVLSLLLISILLSLEDESDRITFSVIPKFAHKLADTPACVIPVLDPMDPSIAKFVQPPKPLDCGNGSQPLIHSDQRRLWVSSQNITDCCYQKLGFEHHDSYSYREDCKLLPPDGLSVDSDIEFVRVRCNSSKDSRIGSPLYDFHAFVPAKRDVERHCKNNSESEVSVLILGLDSMSRVNFHRQMPLTLNLLRQLEAVEMLGYNKVADNTFPNLVPVLAGLSESELKETCWPKSNSHFDDCPFMWKDYARSGYRTLFMEDIPYIGMFNYMKKGFLHPPTDYYLRPFMKALDEEIGHSGLETSNRCAGSRLQIEITLDYVEKFVSTFTNGLYWGLVWTSSLSHDDLNAANLIDPHMRNTLERLSSTNLLNNTVLVLLSDHGSRLGKIRATYQGRFEDRLPFLFFVFPEWFKKRYSSAIDVLQANRRRLTSPYDLHETLMDLLHLPTLGFRRVGIRGRSLFGPIPVPLERTCEQAGISDHWCACYKSSFVNPSTDQSEKVAETVVSYINEILQPYPLCAKLQLAGILEVRAWQHPMKSQKFGTPSVDYMITLETTPGGALFEATVVKHGEKLEIQSDDISRINRYGEQSACISDFHMKLFCYCVDSTNLL
ncbi:uncharacterized protein [Anabrus simplex]|uniref:uncharacterized protein isoform X2 n=1 Tax=Anabrus simplex TaxID=316456 RepID=UPI0035A36E89